MQRLSSFRVDSANAERLDDVERDQDLALLVAEPELPDVNHRGLERSLLVAWPVLEPERPDEILRVLAPQREEV